MGKTMDFPLPPRAPESNCPESYGIHSSCHWSVVGTRTSFQGQRCCRRAPRGLKVPGLALDGTLQGGTWILGISLSPCEPQSTAALGHMIYIHYAIGQWWAREHLPKCNRHAERHCEGQNSSICLHFRPYTHGYGQFCILPGRGYMKLHKSFSIEK